MAVRQIKYLTAKPLVSQAEDDFATWRKCHFVMQARASQKTFSPDPFEGSWKTCTAVVDVCPADVQWVISPCHLLPPSSSDVFPLSAHSWHQVDCPWLICCRVSLGLPGGWWVRAGRTFILGRGVLGWDSYEECEWDRMPWVSWKVGVRPLPLPLLHSSGLVEEITWLVRFDSAMPFGKMFMLPGLTHVPERWEKFSVASRRFSALLERKMISMPWLSFAYFELVQFPWFLI